MQPTVSVVIACYNSARFLERCVTTIRGQTLALLEIILIDDCSSDGTLALAHALAQQDQRIRVEVMPRNGGPAAARNRGFALSTGRWIAIVDSDDLLHPARLDRLIKSANAADADMIADDLLVFQDGRSSPVTRFLSPAVRSTPFDLGLPDYLRQSRLYGGTPNPGFLKPLIRRDSLAASGVRYDERLRIAEDDDLVARLLLAGLRYRIDPVPMYFYRKHWGSISHRLSVATIDAMCLANAGLVAAIIARHPQLGNLCRARSEAFERAAAFERAIAALRQRRVGTALRVLSRAPGAWPLLRMPISGAWAKLRPVPVAPGSAIAPDEEWALLRQQADAALG